MNKIPLEIQFSDNFIHKNEFLEKIKNSQKFLIPHSKYFEEVNILLLKNESISDFCEKFTPKYENMFLLRIYVCYETHKIDSFEINSQFRFVYSSESFENTLSEILMRIHAGFSKIIQRYSGINFYKRFFMNKIEIGLFGEALFFLNYFQNAISVFSKDIKNEYFRRIVGLSQIYSNKNCTESEAYDILILHNRIGNLLTISSKLEPKSQFAVNIFLSTTNLPENISILIFYKCFKGFLEENDSESAKRYMNSIRRQIRLKISDSSIFYRVAWLNVLRKIESEYFE